jgi:hypothetical protein
MHTEAAGHGWQFVPIPGVAPLPRELKEDEYYPLHVALFPDKYPENCKHSSYPHKHIVFMGDDGIASVWPPIESKPFLDHVLQWFADQKPWMYGAEIEHIKTALEPQCVELLDQMTPREQALIDDPAQWERPATSHWVMLE